PDTPTRGDHERIHRTTRTRMMGKKIRNARRGGYGRLTGAEVGDGDPALAAAGPELEVEAADAGVVDEHVAVGVPPHRHRRVLLRRLRRGGRVEEDVLE